MKHLKTILTAIKSRFTKMRIRFHGRDAKKQKAIRKAKRLHEIDGKRYRVFFFGYRYRVWDRKETRRQIKSGLFRAGLKAGADFDRICFFDTDKMQCHVCQP